MRGNLITNSALIVIKAVEEAWTIAAHLISSGSIPLCPG
jgi:hypothetical protein